MRIIVLLATLFLYGCTITAVEQYPLDRASFTEVRIIAHKEWKL